MLQRSLKNSFQITFSICFFLNANAQKSRSAEDLYYRRNFSSALQVALADIKKDSTDRGAYLIAGSAYMQMEKNDSAIVYLEKVNTSAGVSRRQKMFALLRLGYCYDQIGNYTREKEVLDQCVQFKRPKNLVKVAHQLLIITGLDEQEYGKWIKRESRHFHFYFEDTLAIKNIEAYIEKHDNSFDSINSILNAKLPQKIDFYVWTNAFRAEQMMGRPLAFADSRACMIHTSLKNTLGHEMTHCISYYASKPINTSKLINEGICVYFDFSNRDKLTPLISSKQTITSVADVWRNSEKVSTAIVYPLGGELVKRLIETFGKEKFMQLLADQTYESAKNIYGAELDVLLKKLDEDLLVSK